MSNPSSTSLTSWAKAIKKALDLANCDSLSLFQEAGLDIQALEDPNARYPLERTAHLWKLAVRETGDPSFGLKVASQVNQTTFHALGHSISTSSTIKDSLDRILRYYRIVTDATELELLQSNDEYHFIIRVQDFEVQPEAIEAFVSVFLRTFRALAGRNFSPVRVELRRNIPADITVFEDVLRTPLLFSSLENKIVFDAASIERKLEGANPELAHQFDQITLQYLSRFDKKHISPRVKVVLIQQLPRGEPNLSDIAKSLNLSTRSLQRKLSEEYTTFKELLNTTRQELALSYIENLDYSISEITYLLGFSDTSSFSRAFRRWFGVPPIVYRNEK